jgi:hypothetical protein
MRCCAFGIAYHSPEDVISTLIKSHLAKPCDIGIVPPDARIKKLYKNVLFLSTLDFRRNLSVLNGTTSRAFVFSNPIDISRLNGVTSLDFSANDDFSFMPSSLALHVVSKSVPSPIKYVHSEFLNNLVNSVKHGSLLNPLMTFVYSLSPTSQLLVKLSVIDYLYNGRSQKYLTDRLKALSDNSMSKLLTILSADTTTSYAKALQTIRLLRKQKRNVDIDSVAKATNTSSYELSYMLSVFDSSNAFSDSFDKAKNRRTKNDPNKSNR